MEAPPGNPKFFGHTESTLAKKGLHRSGSDYCIGIIHYEQYVEAPVVEASHVNNFDITQKTSRGRSRISKISAPNRICLRVGGWALAKTQRRRISG